MEIPAGEFKAKCLKLMEQVARTREPIVITKRGRPVAKLVPPDDIAKSEPLFGYMAGTGTTSGDIGAADHTEWSAMNGEEDHLYDLSPPDYSRHRVADTPRGRRHK